LGVPNLQSYKSMKGNVKCKNWSGLRHSRSSVMSSFDKVHTTFHSTNSNYASIFYHFQVIVRYLSRITDFNLPHLYLSLTCSQKTRVPQLLCGIVCNLSLAILIEIRCVTDTPTHTHNDSIYCASVVSRGKKQHCIYDLLYNHIYIYNALTIN